MTTDQEKVELEQVPLKSDVDPPAGGETEPTEAKTEAPEKKKCSRWIFRKSKNGEVATTEVTVTEEKKKACKWWHRKEPKEGVDGEPQMTVGINMLDRDEKCLNEHVSMEFGDVFGEPDSSHSLDWAWRATHRVFNGTANLVYKLLTALFAIPLAIIFGVLFALFSAVSVFICTPIGKLIGIPLGTVAKAWDFVLRRFLDPIFTSMGLCCGAMAARKSQIHDSPTVLA